ncbi:MAG: Coenzyme F420 hydrogenase/dehydrogenase, beta subunit C-terminal domain [Candidatus Hodarchaeota archaeon]
MIFSSPGYKYNESDFRLIKKFKELDSVKISKLENIGTLDITQLLKAIYLGFDGIFIIIKGRIITDEFISKFNSFHKPIEEVNRILRRRGLGNQRVKLFKFDGTNQTKLDETFKNFLRKLIHSGPNPVNSGIRKTHITSNYNYDFETIPIKKLLYSSYKASYNFQYRSLFKAKENILKSGRYNESDLTYLLDSIFEAETARNYILDELKRYNPLTLKEIINLFDFSVKNIIRDIFYLKEQGYIEEIPEYKLNHNKSIGLREFCYKYRIKEIKESYRKNYFKSVSIVQDNKVCCRCGLCTSICPVDCLELTTDYLYRDEGLCCNCGLCYSVCPQSFSIDKIKKLIKKSDTSLKYSNELGYYKNIFSARTLKYTIKKVGQDGGVVTSLLNYLFNQNLINAVITIKHSKKYWKPEVSIIEKVEDLYKAAGSTYVHAPILSILDKAKKFEKLALVALPCKIKAIFKGELFPVKIPLLNNIKYKIGIFCRESFPYKKILQFFRNKFSANIDEITKMDINVGKFVITLRSGEIFSIPLEECELYGSDFCNYCDDFTAELADLSIGSIGSKVGWSSVITRTKTGEEIFNGAIKYGLIEIKSHLDKKPLQLKIERLAGIKRDSSRPIELNII